MKLKLVSSTCLAVLASSFIYASVSFASVLVESGFGWWGDVGTPAPTGCAGMYINAQTSNIGGSSTVYNKSVVKSLTCTNINPQPWPLPQGWIGALAEGYKNGGFCGSTGWRTSTTTTAEFTASGSGLCSNPSGTQIFKTIAFGEFWNGNGYTYYGGATTPNMSL